MNLRVLSAVLLALLAALLMATAVHGTAIPWIPQVYQNVSESKEVSNIALAIGDGTKSIAWRVKIPSGERKGDLILAQNAGYGWVTTTVTTTQETQWPSLVYSGTQLYMAWAQGEWYENPTVMGGNVWERDPLGKVRSVSGNVYGADWLRPRLQKGMNGLHMVFAATVISTQMGNEDLYYAYRPWTSDNWTLTVVITHDQVATGRTGGVFYPDLAVDGNTVHIVWEQRNSTSSPVTYTVWYISGTTVSGSPQWGNPVPLSQPNQNGERPVVAVDGNGRVHVAWTDYITETEQYVYYRCLESGGWTPGQLVSGDQSLKVNQIRPTTVWPAIAARGNLVCIAWHGFYPDMALEMEEIFLRCSRDGGRNWGPIMNVSQSSGLSLFPAIAIGSDNAVHLVWEEFHGGSESSYFFNYDAIYARGPSEVHQLFLPLVLRNYR